MRISQIAHRVFLLLGVSLFLVVPATLVGKGGVYPLTGHGDPTRGIYRDTSIPRGECGQCHTAHGAGSPNPFSLFAPNTNGLCYSSGCHATSGPNRIYQGPQVYDVSGHAAATSMVWPGADPSVDSSAPRVRPTGDWGKCVNCHDPHGTSEDGTGLIPSLVFSREEKLCVVCHDGSPARKDIKAQFNKPYRHPIATSQRHSISEGGNNEAYGTNPADKRHAECVDCHNPHVGKGGISLPLAPNASDLIRGVGRVGVINRGPGIKPTYTYRGPSDATPPVTEYQVCFKCHSSWTTQPTGQLDLAVLFNSNNPSYHPVEARGRNRNIDENAFVDNWDATKLIYCTDCHSSDDPEVRGPHGSQHRYILKKKYIASSSKRRMSSDEICFDCHRYETYADDDAGKKVKRYSRFNQRASKKGHSFHVGEKQVPCYACHDSHGSTTQPYLIVTGRNPGLTKFTQTRKGGTCESTCHKSKKYKVNYPR